MKHVLLVAALGLGLPGQLTGAPAIVQTQPLLSATNAVAQRDFDTFSFDFRLANLTLGTSTAEFTGTLVRRDGHWQTGAGNWKVRRSGAFEIDARDLRIDQTSLTGPLRLRNESNTWTGDINATLVAIEPDQSRPDVTGMTFWTIQPQTAAVIAGVTGTFSADGATGTFTGRLITLGGMQRWSLGRWEGGLRLDLDMGTQRQNWNHARIAVHPFAVPQDWSGFDGVRVAVTTTQPRRDAAVSFWIGEADGSWYYVKAAVPLTHTNNEAVLWFEDFAEAEWVAPGNHMDEDYSLDRASVGSMGIGVVNPLGIGRVSFTVTALELVKRAPVTIPPAQLEVTGSLLSVNGHDKVPPGIFGGYAPDLPQRYRPGCQRHLYAGSYPRVPRQNFVTIRKSDILDEAALRAALKADTPLARHFQELVKEPDPPAGRKRRELDPLTSAGKLQRSPQLYDAAAWAGIELPATDRQEAERMARGQLNDTEVMELNRRLLPAAFPNLITGAPAGKPTELFYVDCHGERKEPAHLLRDPNWRANLAANGKAFGEGARKAGYVAHWEFWNEPYLNWAERSRVHLDSKWYRTEGVKEGDPVQVKYEGGPVIPHFKWVSKGAGGLKVVDETAFSYWSGRGNGFIYDEMLAVIGPAIKQANPAVQVIAGWGFRWNEDHWAAWDLLYKPTIDRHIAYIDGVHEHHYQGDTVAMNGSYEVLAAYGMTQHDKWLYSYNTETSDLVDAPARGGVDTPEKVRAASGYRKGIYNLRDCLYSVLQSPDKLRSRTVIHNDAPGNVAPGVAITNSWADVSYGLLANLRGRLADTASDDPDFWCVASVDGTDPEALPPAGTPPTLVAVLFNDHRQPRTANLKINAPGQTSFTTAQIERTTLDLAEFRYGLAREEQIATGQVYEVQVTLPARSAWKVALPLTGAVAGAREIVRTQFFAPAILQTVAHDQPLVTTAAVTGVTRRYAQRAWVRAVVEDVAAGEAHVQIGGQQFALPKALTADNINRIVEVPVPLAALAGNTELTFTAQDGAGGYRVDMASIIVEHKPVPPAKQWMPLPVPAETPWSFRVLVITLAILALLVLAQCVQTLRERKR